MAAAAAVALHRILWWRLRRCGLCRRGVNLSNTAAILALALAIAPRPAQVSHPPPPHSVVYGSNAAAGAHFEHDGVRLYYEVYGRGPPLLLIHGNGCSIWTMKYQIAYFRRRYRVIAMDSRDHGRSGDAKGPLTFEAMTDDLAALLDHLHTGPVLVLGWSDGADEALLLGIRHPLMVTKIAAMAANLDPGGIAPEVVLKLGGPPPKVDSTQKPTRAERVDALDRDEPHIRPEALEAITAPTLVMASDHDVIEDEHTLEIYHHLPNSQLAIFPDATHMIPADDPDRFNATVDRFFRTPFVKKDRVLDFLKTNQRLTQEYKADHAGIAK
jgi:pimeloyl-ACP methyl ester carboxylesterase